VLDLVPASPTQHDLALPVPGLDAAVRLGNRVDVDHRIDYRAQRAALDCLREPLEGRPLGVHENTVHAQVAIDRFFEVALEANDRRRRAPVREHAQASREQFAADEVRDAVEASAELASRVCEEIRLLAIEHDLDSELPEQRVSRRARGGGNVDAVRVGQLNEHAADAAGATVNEE
jgi:hypothetical protein